MTIGFRESALARPINLAHDGPPDLADLAAANAVELAQNHPFADGNKRLAFLAIGLFLALNGQRLCVSQLEARQAIFALAAGELDESAIGSWIRRNMQPYQGNPSRS